MSTETTEVRRLGRKDLARHLAGYLHVKLATMNAVGLWLSSVPESVVRVGLGAHVGQMGWQGEQLLRRIRELRCKPEDYYQTEAMAEALKTLAYQRATVARLAALYCALLPYEEQLWRQHMAVTEPVTEWYLDLCAYVDGKLIRWGEAQLAELLTAHPERAAEAAEAQAAVEALLTQDAATRPQPGQNYQLDPGYVPTLPGMLG